MMKLLFHNIFKLVLVLTILQNALHCAGHTIKQEPLQFAVNPHICPKRKERGHSLLFVKKSSTENTHQKTLQHCHINLYHFTLHRHPILQLKTFVKI